MVIERKNIEDLTPHEVEVYKHAVQKLKDDPDPSRNYQYHADLHNKKQVNPPHGCEHYSDLFLPWHRFHLYNFERALQASDPRHPELSTANVTIPFWDWTAAPRTGVRYPHAFEDAQSVLFHGERNSAPSGPFYTPDDVTHVVRTKSDWGLFAGGPKATDPYSGALEQAFHEFMHIGFLGPPMKDPKRAAEDPIYWSFHAYIDRLWERWTRVHKLPPTSLDAVLQGFPTAPTVASVVDIALLGYGYSFLPDEVRPVEDRLAGRGKTVVLDGGDRQRSYRMPSLTAPPTRAYLWLTQLVRPVGRSFLVDVLIHQPGVSVNRENASLYRVGQFVFWEAHHVPHGEKVGAFLDITEGVARDATAARAVTLIVRPFDEGNDGAGVPGSHPGHDHGSHRQDDLHFESVLLQLDGGQAPELTLGTAGASPAVTRPTRFELHVRPMFRLLDRDEMLFKFDLWSYDDVKANADAIRRVLKAGTMPVASAGGPWPVEWIQLFERWMAEGFPRLELGSASQGGYTARRSRSTVTLTAKGKVPAEGFDVWLETRSANETARQYTLLLEAPDVPVGTEKPFTAIASFEAPPTLTAVFVTDADGTHEVTIG